MNERKHFVEMDAHYKGYHIVVVLQKLGHRCGYVLIPPYMDAYFEDAGENEYGNNQLVQSLLVHGGITFDRYETTTVYLPEPGHWIGFDCAHYNDGHDWDAVAEHFGKDVADRLRPYYRGWDTDESHTWTVEEVANECKELVNQLLELTPDYVI